MKQQTSVQARRSAVVEGAALAFLLLAACCNCGLGQGVSVRLSFKFILNASGNRPATGDINTDAEVNTQLLTANQVFSNYVSELRHESLEIVDVAGVSQWYLAEPIETDRDGLRAAAMAAPATYHWRDDAINVYITAGQGTVSSAISKFPPDNDIILVSQGIWDNMLAHEAGHSLNLLHTHEGSGDGCSDTLPDDRNWNQDGIAQNAFGVPYNQLNTSQQAQVDLVFYNLMSYHNNLNGDTCFRLSPCQLDRLSTQAYTDRGWLLSKEPVYVDSGYSGSYNGSFNEPYQTIQQAINAGVLNGRVLVLKQGNHPRPTSALSTWTDVVTRRGASTVQGVPPPYVLPRALEFSTNPAVKQAVIAAQECDRRKDMSGALTNLLQAASHATGRERDSLQMELAQRFRDTGRPEDAEQWFRKVAAQADQEGLRRIALERAGKMRLEAEKKRAAGGPAPDQGTNQPK